MAAYADDLTVFLGETDDIRRLIKILTEFKAASGLAINLEKSEVMSFRLPANTVGTLPEIFSYTVPVTQKREMEMNLCTL